MATAGKEITFIVPGQAQPGGTPTRGTVKASVRLGAQRGGAPAQSVTARTGEDVVVLTVANGPTLVLHPENARLLLQSQAGAGTRGAADNVVSARLAWPTPATAATRGLPRGGLGEATLAAFQVLTGIGKDPAADLATAAITRRLDGAVEERVYPLPAEGPLTALKGSGTRQDQVGAPGKLWTGHPVPVRALCSAYGGRVFAPDHPTLGASPIANALALARAM